MSEGLKMLIGMSLAYITSFAGLIIAYRAYKKHHKGKQEKEENKND